MLLIDSENNSAICVGMLCNVKQRQTHSGKPFTTFSIIVGTHKDEFDNWQNEFQSCIAYAGLADYINELSQEQNRTKYLVCGALKESEYNGEIKTQIVVEYISPQPLIEQPKKSKTKTDDWDDTEFSEN